MCPVELEIQNFDGAEVREFPRGRFQLCHVAGQTIGRARYEPGWRWSRDVGPSADTTLCELDHVGVVVAGRAAVQMADGEEFVLSAGDAFAIPAGHDSWVLGDEPYESIHLLGAEDYAA
jgi:mannose-6-phosphate isomerase-like protein (cupin superfamily)